MIVSGMKAGWVQHQLRDIALRPRAGTPAWDGWATVWRAGPVPPWCCSM